MPTQTRTFQLRLPKGAHEEVLDAWGTLSGRAMRTLHARVRKAEAAHRDGSGGVRDADGLRQAKNTLKSQMLVEFGLTGRQYNGIEAQLKGIVESRRACAALDAERLTGKLEAKTRQLAGIEKRLADDAKARADHQAALNNHAAKVAAHPTRSHKPPPLPTKAQAAKMLDTATRERMRFDARAKERSIAALTAKLDTAQGIASGRVDPSIVFGGKALLQARTRIHPNDDQSLASWRRAWDEARSAGFMLMGGKDEAAGNKSCKMLLEAQASNDAPKGPSKGGPTVAFHLRLPDALIPDPSSASPLRKHLRIPGVALPAFGRDTLLAAMARNAGPVAHRGKVAPRKEGTTDESLDGGTTTSPEGLALTYRFVRDAGFKHATLSAWRVCITVEEEVPEIRAGMAQASGSKAVVGRQRPTPTSSDVWSPHRTPSGDASVGKRHRSRAPLSAGPRLGVDVNADCLALALISADGNPLRTWTLPLHLRGLTSGQREAKIGDVAKAVVDIALAHNARIVLEALDFTAKKREMGMEAARSLNESGYRRMLSSLAYAAIGTGISRRAARHGVSVGFVNPAYTSLIGSVNWMQRVGHRALTVHEAAACAIARRDAGFSERINGIHGRRGRRVCVPAPEEARKHVWRAWARVHRERLAAAKATRGVPAHPSGRGEGRRAQTRTKPNPDPVGGASPPVALGAHVQVPQGA